MFKSAQVPFASVQRQTKTPLDILQEQMAQKELMQANESRDNDLRAQRDATDYRQSMAANPANPRTITDNSMTLGSADTNTMKSSVSGKKSLGGFGGIGLPQIDGRYMSLVEPPKVAPPNPQLNTAQPPVSREAMPQDSFGPGDATAFQDAAYGRLKARAGQQGRGAVEALAAELAGRGISGESGTFGRGVADRIMDAQAPLTDLNVAHLGQEYEAAQRARELSANRSNAIFQGGIAQRGQDISTQQALNALKAQLELARYQGEISQNDSQLDNLYRMLTLNA